MITAFTRLYTPISSAPGSGYYIIIEYVLYPLMHLLIIQEWMLSREV